MRISPLVLLLFAMLGCGPGTQPAEPPAESGGDQAQQQKVAASEKQDVSPGAKTPATTAVKKHMTPAQLALGDPIVNSIGMVLVPIPAGEFQMGSPDSDSLLIPTEKPQHLVKITKPFYLSVYEVTQQQYEKVMGVRPWQSEDHVQDGPDYPAVYFTWNDAVEFCNRLSASEGLPAFYSLAGIERWQDGSIRDVTVTTNNNDSYRLPTEAQWEYACRAGTTTVYSFGDDVSKLGQHAWYVKNARDFSEEYAHRVGQKLPNPWGLYDMHGNVEEFCQDWYAPYGSEKALSDPMGPAQGEHRVLRGGSASIWASHVRSAVRGRNRPVVFSIYYGMRAARTYP